MRGMDLEVCVRNMEGINSWDFNESFDFDTNKNIKEI